MREICQSGFDERGPETGSSQTGLRGRGESSVTHPPGGYLHCAGSRLYSRLRSRWLGRHFEHSRLLTLSRCFGLKVATVLSSAANSRVSHEISRGAFHASGNTSCKL